MKNRFKAARAAIIGGAAALVSCLALTGCGEKQDIKTTQAAIEQTVNFDKGEHIISVPISQDVRNSNTQYNYYPGYEPIGISLTAYGKVFDYFSGGAIVYANVDEVECTSNNVDIDGNYLYLDFGTPLNIDLDSDELDGDIKEFGVGEHIISVPLKRDNRTGNFQYKYHDGYEVVGVATTAYGQVFDNYAGGVVLYKNIVPVKCIKDERGYTTFGIPFEKGMSLNKSID